MTQHKVVSLRLYRLLLRATKPVFRKPYAELLNETVTVFHPHISRLSQGDSFLKSYRTNPRKALREVVQNGAATDIQVCVDMIPDLIRFLRAGKLVYEDDLFKTPRKCHPLGSMRSLYDLSAGGLLLTKLGTLEKLLAIRRKRKFPLDEQHSDLLSRSMEYMKRTFSRTLHARRRDGSASDLTTLGKHGSRAYYAFLALDRLFWLWDTNKIAEIDAIFPPFTYFPPDCNERLMGNTLFFQALINKMDYLNLEAYGSVINDDLYLKIVRKPLPPDHPVDRSSLVYQPEEKTQIMPPYVSTIFPNHPGAIPWKSSSDIHKRPSAPAGAVNEDTITSDSAVNASPLSQTVYTHRLSAKQLDGHHYFADRSYEIALKYHPETYMLEAVMYLDPNKTVFAQAPGSKPGDGRWRVPKDHVIWRIDLSQYHHEEKQGSIPGVSASDEEERKHWLYLDREYQGVELPVPAEFYELPASPDGRFHKQPPRATKKEPVSEEEDSNIFGEDGIVPNVCYVKFARPPSQARIETCLLPHLHYQHQSSSTNTNTNTNKSSMAASEPTTSTTNGPIPKKQTEAADPDATAASPRQTTTDYFRQADSTTITRVAPLENHPSSSESVSTFTTIETVYHQLPSFLTVEARFCEFHEDDEDDDEEEGEAVVDMGDVFIIGDPSNDGVGAAVLTAEEVHSMMKNNEPTDEQVAFAVHFMDFLLDNLNTEAGFTYRPGQKKYLEKSKIRNTPKVEQTPKNDDAAATTTTTSTTTAISQPLDGEPSSKTESDFKAVHADILAENQKQQPRPTERFSYTTIRYGHVLDVDGSWIQVTHDGLRMVFHAELFPPEPLPGMPDSNPMPVVQPLTSAQLMTYLTGLIAREAHETGMRYPNYKVLGSNLAIKESETPEDHESSSDSPQNPLQERLAHQMIGGIAWNRGRQLSWNAAYWNAVHFYFRRRQQAVEDLYAARSKSKTAPNSS